MVVKRLVYNSVAALGRRALSDKRPDVVEFELSVGAKISLVSTLVAFVISLGLIYYTSVVVTTLMMVESPPPPYALDEVYDPVLADPTNKNPNQPDQPLSVSTPRRTKPITHNIRSTLRHLRAQGGIFAGLRGMPAAIAVSIVTGIFSILLSIPGAVLRPIFGTGITSALVMAGAAAMAWQFNTAWAHTVISRKSSRGLFKRLPSRIFWRGLVPATALVGLTSAISAEVPQAIVLSFAGPLVGDDTSKKEIIQAGHIVFGSLLTGFLLQLLIVIPSKITLTRIQASILPAEDEPIVPFDHTYGGRVISLEDGGSGIVSFKDAWSSFSWTRTVRIIWTMFKFSLIESVTTFIFVSALIAQFIYFMPRETQDQVSQKIQELLEGSQ